MPQNTPEEQMAAFLEMRASHVREYHDHKETMAHAALLVSLTLVAGIVSACPWPPSWAVNLRVSRTVLMVGLIWLGIHVYMRWQLRKRRHAARFYDALIGC